MSLYFDHNATTPLRTEVVEAMTAALRDLPGNPSSAHAHGRAARAAVEQARAEIAALVGAAAEEIVFTSGGTEGNDLAIRGLLRGARVARGGDGKGAGGGCLHAVSSAIEHPSVLGALAAAEVDLTLLPVGSEGTIDPEALRAVLRPDTALVTLALANHELGNIHDVAASASIARGASALFHTDAVQAVGKIPLNLAESKINFVSVSGHKLHCPKGVGVLYVNKRTKFAPYLIGGSQENGKRAGTQNVASIVALGKACEIAGASMHEEVTVVSSLRDAFE
ncbi:MAG TPA: aminotransferase class V-fold PLP-dependent enzyme, partial [Polyangia bacterium]